jgi:hypothetical protein
LLLHVVLVIVVLCQNVLSNTWSCYLNGSNLLGGVCSVDSQRPWQVFLR